MANIKSQKKRILTNERAHQRNVEVKSRVKTAVRGVHDAIASGDKQAAQSAYAAASRELDRAAGQGVIHRNQAADRKSGLAAAVKAL